MLKDLGKESSSENHKEILTKRRSFSNPMSARNERMIPDVKPQPTSTAESYTATTDDSCATKSNLAWEIDIGDIVPPLQTKPSEDYIYDSNVFGFEYLSHYFQRLI
jgi:hypothetical protein